MSNSVFPKLPGLLVEEPSPTGDDGVVIRRTVSGRDYITDFDTPIRYRYAVRGRVRAGVAAPAPWQAYSELGVILKFWQDHKRADSFLFDDDALLGTQVRVRFEGAPRFSHVVTGWYDVDFSLITVVT